MKKFLAFLMIPCLVLFGSLSAQAQVIEKGDILVSPNFNLGHHTGFGVLGFGTLSGFVPGMTVNVDIGVHDYVSVGPYVGFAGKKYSDGDRWSSIGFGARGNFHWGKLIGDKKGNELLSDKLDLYYSLGLGGHLSTYKYDYLDEKDTDFQFGFSSTLGVRYYFLDWMGAQMEWGWAEMSWAKIGVTFKF